jgi:hypothetical protein
VLLNLILDTSYRNAAFGWDLVLSFGDDAHNQLKLRFLVEEEVVAELKVRGD